jgi:hypothetical protein
MESVFSKKAGTRLCVALVALVLVPLASNPVEAAPEVIECGSIPIHDNFHPVSELCEDIMNCDVAGVCDMIYECLGMGCPIDYHAQFVECGGGCDPVPYYRHEFHDDNLVRVERTWLVTCNVGGVQAPLVGQAPTPEDACPIGTYVSNSGRLTPGSEVKDPDIYEEQVLVGLCTVYVTALVGDWGLNEFRIDYPCVVQ